jgi:hypothetical protein
MPHCVGSNDDQKKNKGQRRECSFMGIFPILNRVVHMELTAWFTSKYPQLIISKEDNLFPKNKKCHEKYGI